MFVVTNAKNVVRKQTINIRIINQATYPFFWNGMI